MHRDTIQKGARNLARGNLAGMKLGGKLGSSQTRQHARLTLENRRYNEQSGLCQRGIAQGNLAR